MSNSIISLRQTLVIWAILLLMLITGCSSPAQQKRAPQAETFHLQSLPIQRFHLFDIGVTDMNGDGVLDIFTANHSARQSFLLGNGHGGWQKWPLEATGLSQSPMFPGLEDSDQTPELRLPGLYIYWHDSRLVLHSHQLQETPVIGEILFFTPITAEVHRDFGTWKQEKGKKGTHQIVKIHFIANGDGELILTPQPYPRVGSPVHLHLSHAAMTKRTFIGLKGIHPATPDVILDLKDRHGLAWYPLTGEDITPDVIIAGGANLGLTDILEPDRLAYELFEKREDRYHRLNAIRLGLQKDNCAARKISIQDINSDGLVDIYVVCIRNTANQLFLQSKDGTFTESAQTVGLHMPDAGTFAWLDVDEDGRPDLLWAGEDGLWLYHNTGSHFRAEKLQTPKIWAQTITLADFDRDGDGDAFIASKDANILLINDRGMLRYESPKSIGLPQASLTAHWVDVDNDGLMDIFAIPGGIFRQLPNGKFHLSDDMGNLGVPSMSDLKALRSARAIWFDADNDGYQEAIIAIQTPDKQWKATYLRHQPGTNHWLELILHGPGDNKAAMGAKIILQTSTSYQTSRVGWSESSHYGQGHYRVYFGLGDQTTIDQLNIIWPDGHKQTLTHIPADQLLEVSYTNP